MSDLVDVHPLNPRPTVGGVELHFGVLSGGVVYRDAVIRELTGEDEEVLAASAIPTYRKVSMVAANCLVSVGPLTGGQDLFRRLSTLDRFVILVAIRRLSFGNRYAVSAVCPQCGTTGKFDLSLAHVKTKREPVDRTVSQWSGAVPPATGSDAPSVSYKCHVRTGADDEWHDAVSRDFPDGAQPSVQLLTSLDELDGVPLSRSDVKSSMAAVRSLSMRVRSAIRADVVAHEGEIDTSADITCAACKTDWSARLSFDASFFFPQET